MDEGPREPAGSGKKKVDESWKNSVEKEKTAPAHEAGPKITPEASFSFFASTLGMQTLVVLGEIRDPEAVSQGPDLAQAKYLIDTLNMLFQKTKGNLTKEEETMMENLVYDLQMKFVEKSQTS